MTDARVHDPDQSESARWAPLGARVPVWPRAGGMVQQRLWEVILEEIANDEVGNRPDRIEPRTRKRRPKPYPLLTKPRKQARDALRKAS